MPWAPGTLFPSGSAEQTASTNNVQNLENTYNQDVSQLGSYQGGFLTPQQVTNNQNAQLNASTAYDAFVGAYDTANNYQTPGFNPTTQTFADQTGSYAVPWAPANSALGTNPGGTDSSSPSASSSSSPSASSAANNGIPSSSTGGGYAAGGDIPDPGGAIPTDPDSGDMDDTSTSGDYTAPAADPSANADPQQINAALNSVMDALEYGRQQFGVSTSNTQTAGNIPSRPAGPGGEGVNTTPASPTLPVIPQQSNPFGKRVASNDTSSSSDDDNDDTTQALDDGGDVDNPASQPNTAAPISPVPTAPPTPQPQPAGQPAIGAGSIPPRMVSYLMGAGAMPQQQLAQIEAKIDPQGTMDPNQRALLAVASAGGPDQQFSAMQGYRQKFDAYRSFARAALNGTSAKPPNMAAATQAANSAYANVPNGNSIQFTRAKGGVVVHTAQLGKTGGKTKRLLTAALSLIHRLAHLTVLLTILLTAIARTWRDKLVPGPPISRATS